MIRDLHSRRDCRCPDNGARARFVPLHLRDTERAGRKPVSLPRSRREVVDRDRRIHCAGCGFHVTDEDQRTEMQGGHEHVFRNPASISFHIGCFHNAPGCRHTGPLTSDWSWFAGFRWQLALCRNCGGHLGWLYRRSDQAFHGLILDRLMRRG